MKINEFIQKYRKVKKIIPGELTSSYTPHVVCKDGFKMSVQAGDSLYSTPKDSLAEQYEEMEIGFPSQRESLLVSYADDENNLTGTVYGYVPVKTIDAVIKKHGGIDLGSITSHDS